MLPGPTVPLLRQWKRGWNEGREFAYELVPGEEERNGAKKIWNVLGWWWGFPISSASLLK